MATSRQNPYIEEINKATAKFKSQVNSLDGWELYQEKEGVKVYNKKVESGAPALVRGDTVLTDIPPGCTPFDLSLIVNLGSCRKQWDEKQDKDGNGTYFSKYQSIFWVTQKTPWPASNRMVGGISNQENLEDGFYCVHVYVDDPTIPDLPGVVKSKLLISGWKLYWTSDKKIGISHVNQVDVGGSLPTSFMKKLFLQIPLSAGKVRDFASKHGFPPSVRWINDQITIEKETYIHDAPGYEIIVNTPSSGIEGKCLEVVCCSRMFPTGAQAHIKGGQGQIDIAVDEHKNSHITITQLKGTQITLSFTKK